VASLGETVASLGETVASLGENRGYVERAASVKPWQAN
jgi:hypothetical protein